MQPGALVCSRSLKFPVSAHEFPVMLTKLPVSAHREFSRKHLNFLVYLERNSTLQAKNLKNSPLIPGLAFRDGLASDCVLSQPVRSR